MNTLSPHLHRFKNSLGGLRKIFCNVGTEINLGKDEKVIYRCSLHNAGPSSICPTAELWCNGPSPHAGAEQSRRNPQPQQNE